VAGTTNGYLFTLWFAAVFLPTVAARHPGGCNVIMDNASIHMKPLLRMFAAVYGNIFVIFLPPYSPELNPVRSPARLLFRRFSRMTSRHTDRAALFLAQVCHQAQACRHGGDASARCACWCARHCVARVCERPRLTPLCFAFSLLQLSLRCRPASRRVG
jgi:hypothetical protein